MEESSQSKNKEADFRILEKAAEVVQDQLRADEAAPELYEQFQQRIDVVGSQRYFVEPYKSVWGSMVEVSEFVALPPKISEQCKKIECASYMGILPEINRVWVTIDNKLYLWNYQYPEQYEYYDGFSEVIVSVSLSTPRPGVFLDTVKYVLVLASPVEIVLLAISTDNNYHNIKLIPTAYKLPSDNITMLRIIGSQTGRIFMAGNDGNLYELDYSNNESSWATMLGAASSFKCQKINHFAWNWRLVHLLPPLLRTFTGGDESLTNLAIDDVRNVLYSISSQGNLSVFYLGKNGDENNLIVQSFRIFDETKNFLLYNRNLPESSPKVEQFRDSTASGFEIIGMYTIPPIESKKAHLLLVMGNGIRIYLSLKNSYNSVLSSFPTSVGSAAYGATVSTPNSIEISYIRSPPSNVVVQQCASATVSNDMDNGSIPSFIASQSLKLSTSMYSHGLFFMSIDKGKHPDELYVMYEDNISRANMSLSMSTTTYQPPSLKEGISLLLDSSKTMGKVHDIKEVCHTINNKSAAEMIKLFAHSATPGSNSQIKDTTHHSSWDSASGSFPSPITHSSNVVGSSNYPIAHSYEKSNLHNLTTLNELVTQHIPSGRISLQRSVLVLTHQGIHIVRKLRASDILYRHLSQFNSRLDDLTRYFFNCYGSVQACTMCIGLAIGLPVDSGSNVGLNMMNVTQQQPLEVIQSRALSQMLALTSGPTYKVISGLGTNSAMQDKRLVLNGTTHEFFQSPIHDSLFIITSRILRAIWLRRILDVGKKKLDKMWSVELIKSIQLPLIQLRKILQNYYPLAVKANPNKLDFLEQMNSIRNSDDFITKTMYQNSQLDIIPEKTLQQQARTIEDISINKLYRLITRTIHALSLLEILTTVENKYKISIDWKLFSENTFRSVVVSMKVHNKIKELINKLITSISKPEKETMTDQIIIWINNDCYHYFSIGDKFAYEATKAIDKVRLLLSNTQPLSDPTAEARHRQELLAFSSNCVELIINSARYWYALDYVKGTIDGQDSELNKKCNVLLDLGKIGREGIVRLCFEVAKNFGSSVKLTSIENTANANMELALIDNNSMNSSGMSRHNSPYKTSDFRTTEGVISKDSWDVGLYHGGSVLSDNERAMAVRLCYECLIQQILAVGSAVPRLGDGILDSNNQYNRASDPMEVAKINMNQMIQFAISIASGSGFHDMLYERLLTQDQSQLLEIRNSSAEEYLRHKDPIVLYKYYERHGAFKEATKVMSTLARQEEDLDISTRIKYLIKAVASAEKACNTREYNGGSSLRSLNSLSSVEYKNQTNALSVDTSNKFWVDQLIDLKDTLEIAEYQSMTLSKLSDDFNNLKVLFERTRFTENQRKQLNHMEGIIFKLSYKLINITELFTEVCIPYKLWDVCLLLLHASKTEDEELVIRLWRSIIYRIIPDESSTEIGRIFLEAKRSHSRIDIDKRYQRTGDISFEQCEQWLPTLELTVVELGKQLQGTHANSIAFPAILILEELEEMVSVLLSCDAILDRGLNADTFAEIGYSYGTLVEIYMELFDRWAGKQPDKVTQILSSTAHVMINWTKIAMEHNVRNEHDTRQLLQSIRSGRMRSWLEKIRRHISTLTTRSLSTASYRSLEVIGEEFQEINNRVNEIVSYNF